MIQESVPVRVRVRDCTAPRLLSIHVAHVRVHGGAFY